MHHGRPELTSTCPCARDRNSGEILWCADCYERLARTADYETLPADNGPAVTSWAAAGVRKRRGE